MAIMKHSAKKAGKPLGENNKDEGYGDWITISSPENLFRLKIDVNIWALGYQLLLINQGLNENCVNDAGDA